MTTQEPCPIWGGNPVEVYADIRRRIKFVRDSSRAGGGYSITYEAERIAQNIEDRQKSKLTTWILDNQPRNPDEYLASSCDYPMVYKKTVDYIINQPFLNVHRRADRLLQFIASNSGTIGKQVSIQQNSQEMLAWSESTSENEVFFCLNYLQQNGWLQLNQFTDMDYLATVTVAGYSRIAEQETNLDSSQAFVAMWFGESMDEIFNKGIRPAIEDAGYRPLRIDQKPDINKIDDEIIAEIRRSRFVVADFTHGKDGARGGVYYEAGFATGLKIPVIYSCREDMVDSIHFDTRQYAHILWRDPEQFRIDLRNRILARIGDGPLDHSAG